MGSGNKREIINSRERVVSDDWNRMQRFIGADRAELLRFLCDASFLTPNEYGSGFDMASLPSVATVSAPLRADVFEGLCVLPGIGAWDLYVTPGVVGLHDPEGATGGSDPGTTFNADDSPYKLVSDPGINAAGQLVIAANAGPGIRIDTIECQRLEVVSESASVDIFDPSTGLFAPTLKSKVSASQLTYRVRQGTPGGGLPVPVQGWLPLAIASVPSSATSNNGVAFWDVRPVVRDRAFPPGRAYSAAHMMPLGHKLYHVDPFSTGGKTQVGGYVTAEAFPGFAAGGVLLREQSTLLDAQSATDQEPGFSLSAHQIWYVWLLFPYGLPRWVKYLTAPTSNGVRFPSGPKGIPVVTTKAPNGIDNNGLVITPITTPAATGLGVGVTCAACVGAFGSTAAGIAGAASGDGDWVWLGNDCSIGPVSPSSGAGSPVSNDWTLTLGTHFPANAKAVRVILACGLTGTISKGVQYAMRVYLRRNGYTDEEASFVYWEAGGAALGDTGTIAFMRELVIPRIGPGVLTNSNIEFTVEWNFVHAGLIKGLEQCMVVGWKL